MDVDVRKRGDQGDELGEHRSTLAEDPIKEVAVMQYLRAFVGDERRRRRRRRGEGGGGRRDDEDYLGRGHGWEGASDPARQPNVVRADRLFLTDAAMCE
jgi:hypothetical protein